MNTKRLVLTPSVVPVITCKPSYVDLIYMPCGKTVGIYIYIYISKQTQTQGSLKTFLSSSVMQSFAEQTRVIAYLQIFILNLSNLCFNLFCKMNLDLAIIFQQQ